MCVYRLCRVRSGTAFRGCIIERQWTIVISTIGAATPFSWPEMRSIWSILGLQDEPRLHFAIVRMPDEIPLYVCVIMASQLLCHLVRHCHSDKECFQKLL